MGVKKVLLINMPWGKIDFPSIQLGILKKSLQNHGLAADILYENLSFARLLGYERYHAFSLSSGYSYLLEWFFNEAITAASVNWKAEVREIFDKSSVNPFLTGQYLPEALTKQQWENKALREEDFEETCINIKKTVVPDFLYRLLEKINFHAYDIIAFTCTFSQTIPALSCARLIKNKHPDKVIILGGSAVSGEAGREYIRVFPWIDFIVNGEGEVTLPSLVTRLRGQAGGTEDIQRLKGISFRNQAGEVQTSSQQEEIPMDRVPIPDYKDYFRQVKATERAAGPMLAKNTVLFEASRGCWWGEKSQCRFCGLNGENIRFRHKPSSQLYHEILSLSQTYRCQNFICVDNVLDYPAFEPFFDKLIQADLNFTFFWEVKPHLKKAELQKLYRAGVRTVQAGIESFSTDVLKLIRKGSSKIQNLRFLRDCDEVGIAVTYNYLWGFPGEKAEHYDEISRLIPAIMHLTPPLYPPKPMILQRNSGYYKEKDERVIQNMEPMHQYAVLFAGNELEPEQIALNYSFQSELVPDDLDYLNEITHAVKKWNLLYNSAERPVLVSENGAGYVNLYDTRSGDLRAIRLTGITAWLFRFCRTIKTDVQVMTEIAGKPWGSHFEQDDIVKVIAVLVSERLILQEGRRYLSLAHQKDEINLRIPYRTRRKIEQVGTYNAFAELPELRQISAIPINDGENENRYEKGDENENGSNDGKSSRVESSRNESSRNKSQIQTISV